MMSRIWFGVLVVSLGVNLALAGFMFGHGVASKGHHPRPPSHEGQNDDVMSLAKMLGDIPELAAQDREIMRDVLKQQLPPVRQKYREIGEARRQAFNALTQEPFDQASIDAAFARVTGLQLEQSTMITNSVTAAIAALPEDRRAHVQEIIRERGKSKEEARRRWKERRGQNRDGESRESGPTPPKPE